MANYYADCEFNGYKGELISLGLVREDGEYLYLADLAAMFSPNINPWVKEHVVPIVEIEKFTPQYVVDFSHDLQEFFGDDTNINIHVDWPADINHISELLMTGPGTMINIPRIQFTLHRVDAYPSSDPSLVQHNALADAFALRLKLKEK